MRAAAPVLALLLLLLEQEQERRVPGASASPSPAVPPARGESLFTLEIPELALKAPGDSSLLIPRTDFTRFRIHIRKQPSQVSYGNIYARVNTESANIVMTTAAGPGGIVCDFDLARHGGFEFQSGRNSVEIEVKDNVQRRHYASFLVQTQQGPADPTPPPGRFRALAGRKWAVVVGISQYRYAAEGIPNLRYADRDAQAFRDFLASPGGGGFPQDNILFLVNEAATSQALRSALFTFLTRSQAEDLVVLYFACHGSPDPNDRRNLYLITHDTRPDDMGGTAFPMWQLQDVLTRVIKAKRVALFTDACHSQGISGAAFGAQQNNLVNQYLSRYAADAKHVLLAGSDISQSSYEDERWGGGHGAFTHFMLEGLRGAADYNHDGTVTAGELFPYVRLQVKRATEGRQTPTAVAVADDLPLAGVGMQTASR